LIIPIHAANPGVFTGSGNWTYLLTGKRPVLIDAGVGERAHLDDIARHGRGGPAEVIVTHAHPDHATGVMALAERWPQARFRKLPWPDQDGKYSVPWIALTDGQVIEAGDDSLEVVHTPGHAPDHICLWQQSSSTLFSGDLVVAGSTVVIPASHGGSLTQYLRSLRRIAALAPARLLPAHGVAIADPQAIIRQYIDHRRDRERQVMSALDAGCTSIEQITAAMYVGLSTSLVPMAQESVRAHLEKLHDEGFVRKDENGWYRRPQSP
jgi:glyoxylase-like metal-dependent hydrolase (beta-lactamase superfamily II)